MFSSEPSEVGYYSAESEYGKAVLRQAQRTDTHVYRLLSARIVLDTSQLRAFMRQDDRVSGQQRERAIRHWERGSDELMDVFRLLPEAVDGEAGVDDVAEQLAEMDKQT